MIHVFFKEFTTFLNSLIAYVVIGAFLMTIGLLMWVFPETSVLEYGYADMDSLFSLGPYVFIFLIPAITMRSFAEEHKSGTLELLFSRPLSDWQIVLGKYLASVTLVLLAILPTLVYYFSVSALGNPPGNIDTPGVIGSYIGMMMLATLFCSIGIFASTLTSNQIVAFILGAFLCFIFYSGFDSLSSLDFLRPEGLVVKQLGVQYHYDAMSKGLIDTRDVIYFLSVSAMMILVARIKIGSRLW